MINKINRQEINGFPKEETLDEAIKKVVKKMTDGIVPTTETRK